MKSVVEETCLEVNGNKVQSSCCYCEVDREAERSPSSELRLKRLKVSLMNGRRWGR
ncbi:MAG: hypothetical protein ACTS47_00405 [Candidatus Hodgkinia cicadicola]